MSDVEPFTHSSLHGACFDAEKRVNHFMTAASANGCYDRAREIETMRGLAASARILAVAADELANYLEKERTR
jgi:hypothetical protein